MSNLEILLNRNGHFASNFDRADLGMLPKLRTLILSCADPRVDPAHIFNLKLGESVVLRNSGGRVTDEIIGEIAAMAFLASKMDSDSSGGVELIILHHTQCGTERYSNPELQNAIREKAGVDVGHLAIVDHETSLLSDIEKLKAAPGIPDHMIVSGCMYDVANGVVNVVVKPSVLESFNLHN